MIDTLILLIAVVGLSAVCGVLLFMLLRRKAKTAPSEVRVQSVAERIRAVGKLIGLEVHAKEIATSTKGWSWIPPLLLSQAKIAMIFHFEKQYFVDLSHLRPADVELIDNGTDPGADRPRYRVHLPPVEGSLRLTDVSPYDIQAGRVLGLVDLIPMNAETQRELMRTAQDQAGELFRRNDAKYIDNARRSIEQHLGALLRLFDVSVEIAWREQHSTAAARMDLSGTMAEKMRA
jgi:hypothetical protein